ncbi:mucin-2-like [Ylistrum balloti]|uniref:mucin-2-like n=1 Tax=Ylistrum balloti TaxID=509963 RepID=UPI002905D807|nr:mucin-2-like [Ylistrum balloti]
MRRDSGKRSGYNLQLGGHSYRQAFYESPLLTRAELSIPTTTEQPPLTTTITEPLLSTTTTTEPLPLTITTTEPSSSTTTTTEQLPLTTTTTEPPPSTTTTSGPPPSITTTTEPSPSTTFTTTTTEPPLSTTTTTEPPPSTITTTEPSSSTTTTTEQLPSTTTTTEPPPSTTTTSRPLPSITTTAGPSPSTTTTTEQLPSTTTTTEPPPSTTTTSGPLPSITTTTGPSPSTAFTAEPPFPPFTSSSLDRRLQDISDQHKRVRAAQLVHRERMVKCTDIKTGEPGDNITMPIPMVDRCRGDPRNILGVIVNCDENDMYRIVMKAGVFKVKYTRNQFDLCPQQLLNYYDVNMDSTTTLCQALKSTASGGQGFFCCDCSKGKTQCQTNRCKCYKTKRLCKSRCHNSLTYPNK